MLLHNFGKSPVAFESVDFATPLALYDEWIKAMADCLYGDLTLGGNAKHIGYGDGRLFSYTVDYLHREEKVYFGVLFELPIYQTVTQTVSA